MKKLISLLIFLSSWRISLIVALPSIQCAQTGGQFVSQNLNLWLGVRGTPLSIGAKKYFAKYAGAMFAVWSTKAGAPSVPPKDLFKPYTGAPFEKQSCPYDWNNHTARSKELCDEEDKFAKMRIYSVQQTDKKGVKHTLSGWLHVEVELTDSIRMIYGQMNDEYFSSIGEFITDPNEQCAPSNPSTILTPTPYQYIPCSAIGAREPKPGNAIYMVANEDLFNKSIVNTPYLPTQDLKSMRGIHFTWRLNEYWCSQGCVIN
ncbi:unnamed protein product [Orchesella dallaii]|uniref:Uncharacterized protein n=1 Tax=Orchesella dallaii TaxID=48710 RepID=A0ABP1RYN0_9HEXA